MQTLENWNVAMLDLTPYKPQLIELCKTFSVERLDLVGSAVREDFDAERSDIDVLIQFAGKENLVVSLLSVGAFLVTLEDCVHPISESIQCEDWLKWGIFVPTHLAPTTINVQGKVPLA